MKTPLDALKLLINRYSCARLLTAGKRQFATSKTCENVVSIGRHVVCSQGAELDTRGHLTLTPDFVTVDEESELMKDVERTFRRRKYEYSHWDRVISGYREAEKSSWHSEVSLSVVHRIKEVTAAAVSLPSTSLLPLLHVLDLEMDGYISPHIDSSSSCGNAIAGLSLLSTAVMKLQHQNIASRWITLLLPRRSLYILRGDLRYHYTHEIPYGEQSTFAGEMVPRDRRVSVICRTQP